MKRDLKGYVRIDGSGRIVPGSLVLRTKRPANGHNGKFIQVQTYECCDYVPNAIQTITTPTLTVGQTYLISFTGAQVVGPETLTGTSTPATLVSYLTSNYPGYGSFILSGTDIIYTPVDPTMSLDVTNTIPQVVALPTLTGPLPNYHAQFTFNALTSPDIDTGTITGATLVTYLTTNHSAQGTYLLDGTDVLYTATFNGETLALTAGT